MSTLSLNFEIDESKHKKDGELTEEFKANATASFGKQILDLLKDGYRVNLDSYQEGIQIIEDEDDLLVEDEEGKTKTTKEKTQKEMYNCTINIHVLNQKDKETGKYKNTRFRGTNVVSKNGQLTVEISRPIRKNGDEGVVIHG